MVYSTIRNILIKNVYPDMIILTGGAGFIGSCFPLEDSTLGNMFVASVKKG